MAIKDILIHVDNTKACARRMELATRLAVRHEAHLVALFARAFGNLPNLSSGHTREIDKQREESKARFEELARVNGLSAEFRVAECQSSVDLVTDNVLINARHVDLVILGQHDEDQADGSVPPDLAESVVLAGGRPVLVVPYAGKFEKVGERALVAWNGSRESVRAVNDAITPSGSACWRSIPAMGGVSMVICRVPISVCTSLAMASVPRHRCSPPVTSTPVTCCSPALPTTAQICW